MKTLLKLNNKLSYFGALSYKLISVIFIICILLPNIIPFSYAIDKNSDKELLVTNYEIKDRLYTREIETIYSGMTVEVEHEDIPQDGFNYLLVELYINPKTAILTEDFKIRIENKSYSCIKNYQFIEKHGYDMLANGTINILTSGWIIFEIPQE